MPLIVDSPLVDSAVDPFRFGVRGWLWLDGRQHEIAAIEAWVNDRQVGETSAFHARPDVVAALALPPQAKCGFQMTARPALVGANASFELQLRVRFTNGSHSAPLVSTRLRVLPLQASPLAALHAILTPNARGLEIGAHAQPVPELTPFYTDNVAAFAGVDGRADFLGSALALPLPNDTLDYLCSSHVFEHLANPVSALLEWHRVLRPGGHLYLVVPDKRFTFDEPRRLTPVAHLLDDFLTTPRREHDVGHINEFIYETDWDRLKPGTNPAEKPIHQAAAHEHYIRELRDGGSLDIHFHTFTPDSLHALLRVAGFVEGVSPRFDLIARAERYPADRGDGIGFLLRKRGRLSRGNQDEKTILLPHAQPNIPPLPLVCPVTLMALEKVNAPDGRDFISTSNGRHAYGQKNGLYVLLPEPGDKPIRPWSSRPWRCVRYYAARVRMAWLAN